MMHIKNSVQRFTGDLRGSISVEFVLTIPIIMVVFTLTFGTFHAYLQSSRAAKAMYVVSDTVSRYHVINDETIVQLQGLLDALYLGNSDDFDLRISRISYTSKIAAAEDEDFDPTGLFETADGYYTVDWSRAVDGNNTSSLGFGGADYKGIENASRRLENSDLADYDLPTMGTGAHVILVNTEVDYNSPLKGRDLFLGIGEFFQSLSWNYNQFVWPRDPRGLYLELDDATTLPTS